MAVKLYPPYIEGTIPAFYSLEANEGAVLTVPFSMNRAIGIHDFKQFYIKIKTVQTGTFIWQGFTDDFDINTKMEAYFHLSGEDIEKFNVGQYYKIQMAYVGNDNTVGHFSTVGVVKFTTKPKVIISNLEPSIINNGRYQYLGVYSQENGDTTERVYSSNFKVWDINGNIFAESGEILHNRFSDTNNYSSEDSWTLHKEFKNDEYYFIQYAVKTMNGLEVKSNRYRLIQKKAISPEVSFSIDAKMNYNNGLVELNLIGTIGEDGFEEVETGSFLITRANSKNDYSVWEEISRFHMDGEKPSTWSWKDFTVEQGVTYVYAIQQYNDYGLYSDRILSPEVAADFEDMFLYDGNRQLKIKFNPKVSSFKTGILESRINTLGGKYPTIFRNGYVNYKEFPISGLISYQMDEENFFITEEDIGLLEKTTNLISNNIFSERNFKLLVLDWLNDGNPKLFRSPSEGNYIVRLMNTSLSPIDSLGRMLHSFSTTAFEIEDYNYTNLNNYGFIKVDVPPIERMRWETLEFIKINSDSTFYKYKVVSIKEGENTIEGYEILSRYVEDTNNKEYLVDSYVAQTAIFRDMIPGTTVYVKMQNDKHYNSIQIGVTGSYQIETQIPIESIIIPVLATKKPNTNFPQYPLVGSVTFSYFSIAQNIFDIYKNIVVLENPLRQFIGLNLVEDDKNPDINLNVFNKTLRLSGVEGGVNYRNENIVNLINDTKYKVLEFYILNFTKRPVEKIYFEFNQEGISFYKNLDKEKILKEDLDVYYLFKAFDLKGEFYGYYDPYIGYFIDEQLYSNKIYVNGEEIDLTEIENYALKNITNLDSLYVSCGIMLEATYQVQFSEYTLEDELDGPKISDIEKQKDLFVKKAAYENNILKLKELRKNADGKFVKELDDFSIEFEKIVKDIRDSYEAYVNALDIVLEIYKEDNMLL